MKKISLLLLALFLLGTGSAYAVPFSWDLTGSGFSATGATVSGDTVNFPFDMTTSGSAIITQSLTGGANDSILDAGDTFTEYGSINIISTNANPLGFPADEQTIQFSDGTDEAYAFVVFDGLSGYISDYDDGGSVTTNAATFTDDQFSLNFNPGVGTIKFYLSADNPLSSPGTAIVAANEIASLKLLSASGVAPNFGAGATAFPEGQFGLTAGFQTVRDDFWYLPGGIDFDDWLDPVTGWGPDSILAISFNLGATLFGIPYDLAGNEIGVNVVQEGSFIISPVPEPATMLLFGAGLLGLAGFTRKKIL